MLWKARTISKMSLVPPDTALGRDGLGICLIVRNEERHIAEWAQFHLAAGVSRFIVYDNGCTDRTIAVLQKTLPETALTVMPWDQKLKDGRSGAELHNQVLAYAHCLRNFGGALRWLAFIDVDEFLIPTYATDLPTALSSLAGDAHIIRGQPWRKNHLNRI